LVLLLSLAVIHGQHREVSQNPLAFHSTMTSDKENIVIGNQPAAVKASKAIVASVVQVETEVAAERARRLHFNQLVRTARHWERCHHFDEVGSP
jgi:hypothetical protein